MTRAPVWLLVFVAAVSVAAPARALGVELDTPTSAQVVDERVELDCTSTASVLRCRVEVRLALAMDPGGTAHLSPHGLQRVDMQADGGTLDRGIHQWSMVAAVARPTVVVRGLLVRVHRAGDFASLHVGRGASVTRHALLSHPLSALVEEHAPTSTDGHPLTIEIRSSGPLSPRPNTSGWSNDEGVWSWQGRATGARSLRWRPSRRLRDGMYRGGVFVGIGYEVGTSLRLRVGHDLDIGRHLSWAVALESDAQTSFSIATELWVSSGSFVFFPSVGAAVGTRIRTIPNATAGVRFGAVLHFPYVGFELLLDVFPADEEKVAVAVLLRGSL